jgi:hypothetical protein
MASVGPVVAQQFIGTPEGITAVVLHFDQPLDPTTAQNPEAYSLVRKFRHDEDDGPGLGGPFGGGGGSDSESKRIPIESATYDAANNIVTLVPRNQFTLRQSFTVIVVRGKGPNAVLVPGGAALDGDGNGRAGGDCTMRYKSSVERRFTYKDNDGDRVRMEVQGPGRVLYFWAKRGRSTASMFMRESDAATTVLTGTVIKGKRGDGQVNIAQVSGTSVQLNLPDPPFTIRPLAAT